MPKSFDLSCKKGYYSHLFYTVENLDYVDPYPEPKYYGADYMSGDERARFLEWYEEHKDKIFCNKQELLAYCIDDVNVLRQACCAFRNLFLKLFKMDPFRQVITTSSICNKVLRTMFLKPDTVGIVPRGGIEWETASLLKPFNGWRTLVEQETMLLMPVMGGRYIYLGYEM